MFGHKTNRVLFGLLLLAAALPVPAMTPALLSGKLGAMSAMVEGQRLPLQVDVWRYLLPRTPLLGEVRPEPALLGWVEPEVVPTIVPIETEALPIAELTDPITLISMPSFRTEFPLFPPLTQGETQLPGGGLSPVPEPSTWMLLISGFLVVGHALRSRRPRAVSLTA